MRIKDLMSRGKKRTRCEQDPNTGEVHCQSSRVLSDGTEEKLAEISLQLDGECNTIATNMEEFGEGELEKLDKSVSPRIKAKCRGRPADY